MNWTYFLEAPITLVIIGLTTLVSLVAFWRDDLQDRHVLVPYDAITYREYWRLLSSGFIHGNGIHLGFNMITLLFFGSLLEHRLGHGAFLLLYVVGLAISSGGVTLRYRQDTSYEGTLGASGAVSAVVLGVIILNPFLRFGLPILSDLWPLLTAPAWVVGVMYLSFTLVSMFLPRRLPINHDSHWWGAMAGILMTVLLKPQALQIMQQVWKQV
jgi:membrane associated rhomboid family serine protease